MNINFGNCEINCDDNPRELKYFATNLLELISFYLLKSHVQNLENQYLSGISLSNIKKQIDSAALQYLYTTVGQWTFCYFLSVFHPAGRFVNCSLTICLNVRILAEGASAYHLTSFIVHREILFIYHNEWGLFFNRIISDIRSWFQEFQRH